MSAGHIIRQGGRKGQPIDPGRQRDLERLTGNPQFRAAMAAYDREDDAHDVPFVGGSSANGRVIYWDKDFAAAVNQGQFRIGGQSVDPRRSGKVHEAVEGAIIRHWPLVMQLLGWPNATNKYNRAHDVADVAERHAAEHLGWPWDPYQDAWRPFETREEHAPIDNPPHDLLLEPYKGTKFHSKLATFQMGNSQARHRVAARIGARLAPDGNHYLEDPRRPGKYLMLVHHAG